MWWLEHQVRSLVELGSCGYGNRNQEKVNLPPPGKQRVKDEETCLCIGRHANIMSRPDPLFVASDLDSDDMVGLA